METTELPTHEPTMWIPEKDQILVKHLGKLNEECSELIEQMALRMNSLPFFHRDDKVKMENEIADVLALSHETLAYLGLMSTLHFSGWVDNSIATHVKIIGMITRLQVAIDRVIIGGRNAVFKSSEDHANMSNQQIMVSRIFFVMETIIEYAEFHQLDKDHIEHRCIQKRELKRKWLLATVE